MPLHSFICGDGYEDGYENNGRASCFRHQWQRGFYVDANGSCLMLTSTVFEEVAARRECPHSIDH